MDDKKVGGPIAGYETCPSCGKRHLVLRGGSYDHGPKPCHDCWKPEPVFVEHVTDKRGPKCVTHFNGCACSIARANANKEALAAAQKVVEAARAHIAQWHPFLTTEEDLGMALEAYDQAVNTYSVNSEKARE